MKTLRNITQIAICICIITVLSQLTIPFPSGVPLTFQTFAIAFCAFFLGLKKGLLTVFLYCVAGVIGLPVFSNFGAGLGVFAGPTGGFLYGFLFLVAFCCLGETILNSLKKAKKATPSSQNTLTTEKQIQKSTGILHVLLLFAISFMGLILCHACGVLHYCLLMKTHPLATFLSISAPFLLKDFVSIVCAYFLAAAVKSRLKYSTTY